MIKLFAICCLFVVSISVGNAQNVHVATHGNDTNDGSLDRPFRTVARAIQALSPGDTCFLHAGDYHEVIRLNGLRGKPTAPIVFTAYQGAKVRLNGTIPVEGRWEKEGLVYRMKVDTPIWQLFADEEMVTAARWPNAHMTDAHFWNQTVTYRKLAPSSRFGYSVDERPTGEITRPNRLRDEGALQRAAALIDSLNVQTLAETNVDMTGAIAILNIGSWMSWAQYIDSHEAGTGSFTYSTDFSSQLDAAWNNKVQATAGNPDFWNTKNTRHGQGHYFIEGKQCLDAPNEWWYDHESGMVYVIPPQGRQIDQIEFRGKHATYVVEMEDCADLVMNGIDFFGATVKMDRCQNITVRDAHFKFPAYSRRMLGELGPVPTTLVNNATDKLPSNNSFINCIFEQFDGQAIKILNGCGGMFDNILIHDGDYSCIGNGFSIDAGTSADILFRRITIYNTGSSQSIKVANRSRVTLCRFYQVGVFQSDGAPLQIGYFDGVSYDHNWSHDNIKHAFRFDGGGGPPTPPSRNGTMHHNVAWNTGQMQVKGDNQLIFNNTTINTPGLCMLLWERMNGFHTQSIVLNNLCTEFKTRWWGKNHPKFPGIMGENRWGDPAPLLRDPANGDFRPRYTANEILDKGSFSEAVGHVAFNEDNFTVVGRPDLGAYEYGCTNYWIPGYQNVLASTPIPFDGGINVKQDADLMWLHGYEADAADVYLGTSAAEVEAATRHSACYLGTFTNNIAPPGNLRKGTTYYWRVDVRKGSQVRKGNLWSFTVEL